MHLCVCVCVHLCIIFIGMYLCTCVCTLCTHLGKAENEMCVLDENFFSHFPPINVASTPLSGLVGYCSGTPQFAYR